MINNKTEVNAQIIIIGDEILSGRTIDANTSLLGKWFIEVGLKLQKVTIIPDNEKYILATFEKAWKEADFIITTGGLGPTKDDLTKNTISKFFNSPLIESNSAANLVKKQYERYNRSWDPTTNDYHLIPEVAETYFNPSGLAPGLKVEKEGKLFLCAPGVPRELKSMIEEVYPEFLKNSFPSLKKDWQRITIRTHSIPEEKIFFELMPNLWSQMEVDGKVSSLPQVMGVDILLHINGDTRKKQEIENKWKDLLLKSPLKENIWSFSEEKIEEVLIKTAREKGLTFGAAESCTGGLVGHRVTSIPGCSDVFMGSLVTYSNQAKINCLNVKEETLNKWGAVSIETVQEMALGAKNALNCDMAISISGIAGPNGGSPEKPVGTVCIGQEFKSSNMGKRFQFKGSRDHLKMRFSEAALFDLYKMAMTY